MTASSVLESAFFVHLTLALLHLLWQGVLIAALAATGAWVLRGGSSRSRHAVWLAALALLALCLPVTLGVLMVRGATQATEGSPPGVFLNTRTATFLELGLHQPGLADEASSAQRPRHAEARQRLDRWALWITSGYFIGVLLMLSRLLIGVEGGRRLRRDAVPVEEPRLLAAVREQTQRFGLRLVPLVGFSRRMVTPVLIGVWRPAILLPASLATGLTPGQVNLVIAHELAHLRRGDHLVIVFQRLAESLLFFHPAVWYVSRRLSIERELCCDELVMAAGTEPTEYVESLVRVLELSRRARITVPATAAAMAAGTGRSSVFVQRIGRILGQPDGSLLRLSSPWSMALGFVACLAIATCLGLCVHGDDSPQHDKTSPPGTERVSTDDGKRVPTSVGIRKTATTSKHLRYDTIPILGPITKGPVSALDPPSQHVIMRALEKARPLEKRSRRKYVRIVTKPIAEYVDPPRTYPLIGPAQLHHAHYKCTAYFKRATRRGEPVPDSTDAEDAREVIYIDHNHFHILGDEPKSEQSEMTWARTLFEGNTSVADARLLGLLGEPDSQGDQQAIQADVERLRDYYRGLGFFQVRVEHELETSEDEDRPVLRFVVDEGPRYRVRNVSVTGNTRFSSAELFARIKLRSGQYFDQSVVHHDVSRLRQKYGAEGYAFVNVEVEPNFLEEPNRLDLVYSITEGRRYWVRRINVDIRGDFPDPRISTVLDLISLKPGDLLDTGRLRASELRLRRSGLLLVNPDTGVVPKIVLRPHDGGDSEQEPSRLVDLSVQAQAAPRADAE